MPGKITNSAGCTPVIIDKSDPRNTGMKAHFHRIKAPKQSFEDTFLGRCTEEKAIEFLSEEEDAEIKSDEDLSDMQQIQRRLFTGERPEFIKMSGPDNLVDRAKGLSIYHKGMKRREIETELMKYWIDQLEGDKDLYFSSPIFQQDKQVIDRARKEHTSTKRKREFAEAALTKDANTGNKRRHKRALSDKVR